MGLPLIAHTIQQAQESNLFDAIAVSSDSQDILNTAGQYGVKILIRRPAELATDTAPKMPVVKHCVLAAEAATKKQYAVVVDLDPTSPLRNAQDIAEAVALLENRNVTNVVTAAPSRKSPYFNLIELNAAGFVQLSKPLSRQIDRRQDAPRCYDMNASIYVWKRDRLLECESVFNADTLLYVMPEERSIDIDSETDFVFVEFLMQKQKAPV
jgi:CMP-N-acetylneuraminic acid synthetase